MAVTECEEIQEWLSDYLDGTLESDRHRAVEDHLYLCPNCQAVADDLEESIKSVKNLPSVDLPPGFTQRVMVQVREEALQPTLWDRIFRPFSIKIPIQAAAVVLVGILAVYLYQTGDMPRRELSKTLPAESETAVGRDLKERDQPAAPLRDQPMSLTQKKAEFADEAGAVGALSSRDTVLEEMRAAPMRAELAKEPSVQSGQYRLALGPSKTEEGGVDIRKRVDELIKKFQGRIIEPKDTDAKLKPDSRTQAEKIWIALPTAQYEGFKNELAALGRVQETSLKADALTGSKTGAKELQVEITILPEAAVR